MHPSPLRLPPTCAYATRGATEDEEEAAAWEGRGVLALSQAAACRSALICARAEQRLGAGRACLHYKLSRHEQ